MRIMGDVGVDTGTYVSGSPLLFFRWLHFRYHRSRRDKGHGEPRPHNSKETFGNNEGASQKGLRNPRRAIVMLLLCAPHTLFISLLSFIDVRFFASRSVLTSSYCPSQIGRLLSLSFAPVPFFPWNPSDPGTTNKSSLEMPKEYGQWKSLIFSLSFLLLDLFAESLGLFFVFCPSGYVP